MCEHCRGNGAEPGTPIETCPRCQGAGQLRAVQRTPFGQVMRTAVCDTCHGDGRVPKEPCEVCHGRGRKVERPKVSIDIPAGIADGQRVRVAGRGHAGERGGPAGDLYVLVRVREDSRFLRDGDDLVTAVDVAAPQAALGTTVKVPTVDGETELEIPAGTQPHETLLIRGAGMPALRGRRTGDLRVVVNVVVPRHLNRQQRELLEQLADSMTEHNLRTDEGVFGKLKRAFGGARPAVIRLAVRVRRDQAELVLAELLELAPGGRRGGRDRRWRRRVRGLWRARGAAGAARSRGVGRRRVGRGGHYGDRRRLVAALARVSPAGGDRGPADGAPAMGAGRH